MNVLTLAITVVILWRYPPSSEELTNSLFRPSPRNPGKIIDIFASIRSIGDPEGWKRAEQALAAALDAQGATYQTEAGVCTCWRRVTSACPAFESPSTFPGEVRAATNLTSYKTGLTIGTLVL